MRISYPTDLVLIGVVDIAARTSHAGRVRFKAINLIANFIVRNGCAQAVVNFDRGPLKKYG